MRTIQDHAVSATLAVALLALIPISFSAYPSVYPTGTTIYDPEKAWNGYVVFDKPERQGAVLIDMNGNELRHWTELAQVPGPTRILPGGYIVGGDRWREPHQEAVALVQLDWDGKEVWRFDSAEEVILKAEEDETGTRLWSARLHHDWQREGDPVGYYSPDATPQVSGGRTLILSHKNLIHPQISDRTLEDDYLFEVTWDGEIAWEWLASDHVDELGLREEARHAIYRAGAFNEERQSFDWLHINAATYVGPNQWYDGGDERFHPDNIILSMRRVNIIAIIDRSGTIVWRMGPDYRASTGWSEIGQIIGQHHPHIIPTGLPGAGNLLVFDNGGQSGYGYANPAAPDGSGSVRRHFSRVLEINPVTLEKVWEYANEGGENFRFFSHYVSSAQRLPNGNTMITEGADGRIFEVTTDGDIVWEFISPYFGEEQPDRNMIYRAYRVPYDWIPQLEQPDERAVIPPSLADFRIEPQ